MREKSLKAAFYSFFPGGGIGRYTHQLLQTIVENYSEVEANLICTPDFQWQTEATYLVWNGLKSISNPNPVIRKARFLHRQFINPKLAIEYASAKGINILHFSNINHLSFPFWESLLAKTRIKVTATAHDVRRQRGIINYAWEEQQLKAFYQFADALFVHSTFQANDLMNFADVDEKKIHIVPHGPYPYGESSLTQAAAREQLGLPPDRAIALFFGQLRDEKNLDGLIEAIAQLSTPPMVLVAGKGGGKHGGATYYRALAESKGLSEHIRFIDRYIPDTEIESLFKACDWVALPYKNRFTSQSGVLNIATTYQRPVLVSSAPVLRETVVQNDIGVACESDTPEALAKGIEALQQKIQGGSAFAFEPYQQSYSWAENARKTIQVYQQLLGVPQPSNI